MPIFLKVNHQLESRMPESGQSGSEGGAATSRPYPYRWRELHLACALALRAWITVGIASITLPSMQFGEDCGARPSLTGFALWPFWPHNFVATD
jgi:hypothetical protein